MHTDMTKDKDILYKDHVDKCIAEKGDEHTIPIELVAELEEGTNVAKTAEFKLNYEGLGN